MQCHNIFTFLLRGENYWETGSVANNKAKSEINSNWSVFSVFTILFKINYWLSIILKQEFKVSIHWKESMLTWLKIIKCLWFFNHILKLSWILFSKQFFSCILYLPISSVLLSLFEVVQLHFFVTWFVQKYSQLHYFIYLKWST